MTKSPIKYVWKPPSGYVLPKYIWVLESFWAEMWRILVAFWFKKGIDFNLARLGLKIIVHGKRAYIEI